MSGEIIKEWYFWLVSIATGAFLAFTYDVLRLFRRLVKHGRVAVDIEDLLFWTACFGLSFTLLYYGNNGVIRFAAVFGAAIGMFVYAVTVGRFFVRLSYLIIDKTIGNLIRFVRKIIVKLQKLMQPMNRFAVKKCHQFQSILIRLFQKFQLTCVVKGHKMKVHNQTHSHKKAKDGEGETTNGGKNSKKKKDKAKNTGVSPH